MRLIDPWLNAGEIHAMCDVQCKPALAAKVSSAPSFFQPTSETTRCLPLGLACDAIPLN
jgi:hypothetical protein